MVGSVSSNNPNKNLIIIFILPFNAVDISALTKRDKRKNYLICTYSLILYLFAYFSAI